MLEIWTEQPHPSEISGNSRRASRYYGRRMEGWEILEIWEIWEENGGLGNIGINMRNMGGEWEGCGKYGTLLTCSAASPSRQAARSASAPASSCATARRTCQVPAKSARKRTCFSSPPPPAAAAAQQPFQRFRVIGSVCRDVMGEWGGLRHMD